MAKYELVLANDVNHFLGNRNALRFRGLSGTLDLSPLQ